MLPTFSLFSCFPQPLMYTCWSSLGRDKLSAFPLVSRRISQFSLRTANQFVRQHLIPLPSSDNTSSSSSSRLLLLLRWPASPPLLLLGIFFISIFPQIPLAFTNYHV
ncbi:hypothetical protein ACFX2J_044252 [Malus domestica]